MNVLISGTFAGANKKTFVGRKGEPVEWCTLTLSDTSADFQNLYYTFTTNVETFHKYGLDDKKVSEALVGKELLLNCTLISLDKGYKVYVTDITKNK